MPKPVSEEFTTIQDGYLQEENARKGITDIADLKPVQKGIYLWQGDITTLKCDAIVNAASGTTLSLTRTRTKILSILNWESAATRLLS